MKKKSIRTAIILYSTCLILALSACRGETGEKKKGVEMWCMEDLQFYDYAKKPVVALKNKDIVLTSDLQTYRGVMLGDDAKEALSKYDLEDAYYEISADVDNFAATYDISRELARKYEDVSAEEMLDHLGELPDYGGAFYYIMPFYMKDGEIFHKEELTDEYDYDYKFQYKE